ncbi:MAG: hypothetical protein ACOYNL_07435 [Rickettsiales bacterium]
MSINGIGGSSRMYLTLGMHELVGIGNAGPSSAPEQAALKRRMQDKLAADALPGNRTSSVRALNIRDVQPVGASQGGSMGDGGGQGGQQHGGYRAQDFSDAANARRNAGIDRSRAAAEARNTQMNAEAADRSDVRAAAAREPTTSSRVGGWLKGLGGFGARALAPVQIVSAPLTAGLDVHDATKDIVTVDNKFKLNLSEEAKAEFASLSVIAKIEQRATMGGHQQIGFNKFIEWGNKHHVPAEALIELNPTGADKETIWRSFNNARGSMAANNLEPQLEQALQQAQQLPRPEGVSLADASASSLVVPAEHKREQGPVVG